MSNILSVPSWVKDAIFYQIFPDRFAKSEHVAKATGLEPWSDPPSVHGYKGGDLLGVIEHLPYLQDLGINALYFNPIFQSASNHRYHTHDYFQVDPMLGGNKALKQLLEHAHKHNIKVVLDGVFNHASRGFFQFNDVLENGEKSAYIDWFHIRTFPLNAYQGPIGYDAWWNLPALPKFNTDTQAVREFLWRVGTYWLEFGIDGWRLDVPNEIDDDAFWQEFRKRCRAVNPDCYIVGEIWGEASRWLQGDQFDAIMNYPLTRTIFGFTASSLNHDEIKRCGYGSITQLSSQEFATEIEHLFKRYPKAMNQVQLNLLGSHDTPRALTILNEEETALQMSLLLLFTLPGAPCLYYGDELGLKGGHDPECRQSMPWNHKESWNQKIYTYVKELISLRKRHKALREGSFRTLYAEAGCYIYLRDWQDTYLIGGINTNNEARTINLSLDLARTYQTLIGKIQQETHSIHLAARSYGLLGPS